MQCFVTGASGFVGANLVHELVTRGHRVKALLRDGADTRGLVGADFERVAGDLSSRDRLIAAMRGCDWCFHAAASYHLWLRDYSPMYATNVGGTQTVLEAAASAGCTRIIHTSTAGCVGTPVQDGQGIVASDETVEASAAEMNSPYKQSKWKAELVARGLASRGVPIVIVNPTAPIGPREVKPTPTGRIVLDFLNRRMPAYLDTGLNWVHVRDVAVGHILAAERGRIGERYILGNAEGNWTLKQLLDVLSEITGLPAPRIQIPHLLALSAAYVGEAVANVTGRPSRVPLSGVRMARSKMFFDPAKAIRELGLPQTPPRLGLEDAVAWFRANGFVKARVERTLPGSARWRAAS